MVSWGVGFFCWGLGDGSGGGNVGGRDRLTVGDRRGGGDGGGVDGG